MATVLLEKVYDLDTGEEIIDDVAVGIMVRGDRKVASTEAERLVAADKMIRQGSGVRQVANHIGISVMDAKILICSAGWRMAPDNFYRRRDGSVPGNRTVMVRVKDSS